MRTDLINVCQGTCCKRFYLPGDFYDKRRQDGRRRRYQDADQILGMVIRIKGREHSCKHFVEGRCAIYATRPWMCRTYPDGARCPNDPDCHYSMDDRQLAEAKKTLELLALKRFGG